MHAGWRSSTKVSKSNDKIHVWFSNIPISNNLPSLLIIRLRRESTSGIRMLASRNVSTTKTCPTPETSCTVRMMSKFSRRDFWSGKTSSTAESFLFLQINWTKNESVNGWKRCTEMFIQFHPGTPYFQPNRGLFLLFIVLLRLNYKHPTGVPIWKNVPGCPGGDIKTKNGNGNIAFQKLFCVIFLWLTKLQTVFAIAEKM